MGRVIDNMAGTQRSPAVVGTVAGVLAWALGYGITYVVVADDIRDSTLNEILEFLNDDPATFEWVGWVFYNTHFVDTVIEDVPLWGSDTTTFVGSDGGFTALLYLVPIGMLLLAGILTAVYAQPTGPTGGLLAGIVPVGGYAIVSIIGVFVFELEIDQTSIAPELIPAIVLAGVMYPLVWSGLGGLLVGGLELTDYDR